MKTSITTTTVTRLVQYTKQVVSVLLLTRTRKTSPLTHRTPPEIIRLRTQLASKNWFTLTTVGLFRQFSKTSHRFISQLFIRLIVVNWNLLHLLTFPWNLSALLVVVDRNLFHRTSSIDIQFRPVSLWSPHLTTRKRFLHTWLCLRHYLTKDWSAVRCLVIKNRLPLMSDHPSVRKWLPRSVYIIALPTIVLYLIDNLLNCPRSHTTQLTIVDRLPNCFYHIHCCKSLTLHLRNIGCGYQRLIDGYKHTASLIAITVTMVSTSAGLKERILLPNCLGSICETLWFWWTVDFLKAALSG